MRKLCGLLGGFLFLAVATPAYAQMGGLPPSQTIGWMRRACAGWRSLPNIDSQELAWCTAVMTGYKAGISWGWTLATGERLKYWCAPSAMNVEESIAVFVEWADHNQNRWDDPWFMGMSDAFKAKWPCPKSKTK